MPKYQIYFDTIRGENKYNVDIDEDERRRQQWPHILLTSDCALVVSIPIICDRRRTFDVRHIRLDMSIRT